MEGVGGEFISVRENPMRRGANDASRVRVQLSSSRVVNISSRAYSSRARLDSLTFRVELTRVEF